MAEVVSSNFRSVLPQVEESIERSEFVAIDTEFTGLFARPEDDSSLFDTIDGRYAKLRRFAKTFIICQFGLSAFIKDPKENRYIAHTFNFYVLPRPYGNSHSIFSFQASNAEFLCEHKFDFNKLFYEGIPYLNRKQEQALLSSEGEDLDEKHLQDALGFSLVFRALQKSKKPILGHNMLNDLCLMYEKFHEPLPENYKDFKRKLHELFPTLIDTKRVCFGLQKQLSSSKLLEFSSLSELYEALASRRGSQYALCAPEVNHAEGSQRYCSQTYFHEAGFDAYCVGFVFLRAAHLAAMKGVKSSEARPVHIKQYFRVLEPYTNLINIIRGPISYIRLGGTDPTSRHSDWLTVSSRKKSTPVSMEMVQSHIGDAGSLDMQVLSPSEVLLVFSSKRGAERVLLDYQDHPILHIQRYSWLRVSPFARKLVWGVMLSGTGVSLAGLFMYLYSRTK